MFREFFFEADDRGLNIAAGPPNGPPLLVLHGVLRRWSDFVPLMPSLTARWHVHALDFRGHGLSGRVPGEYLVADYVQDALKVVSTQFEEPVVVYGHSLGAMVAAAVAAELPKQVRAVILGDPPFETMGKQIKDSALLSLFKGYQQYLQPGMSVTALTDALARIRIITPGKSGSVELGSLRDRSSLRFMASCLTAVDPDVLTPIVKGRWLDGYDTAAVIRGIHCPTLVLQADTAAGGMLTDADVTLLNEAIADRTIIHFPGTGHLIHWNAAPRLLEVVSAFLESLR